jgi:hypothetical protein
VRKLLAVLTAGALASAVAASALGGTAAPAAGATALPFLVVQPVCTDGSPTTGDLRGRTLVKGLQFRIVADGTATPLASGVTDSVGDFLVTGVTLPASPTAFALHVELQDFESEVWHEVAARTVGHCAITPDPSSTGVGELPRTVHVTGTGWPRSAEVQLLVDGVPGPSVVAPPAGDIATDVTLPVRPCGPVPIRAAVLPPTPGPVIVSLPTEFAPGVPFRLPRATTTVTVVCPVPTPTPTTPTPTTPTPTTPTPTTPTPTTPTPTPTPTPTTPGGPAATLTVDPLLASGGVGTARGTGFVAGRAVTLTWMLPDGSTAPGVAVAVADAAGRFAVQCLVLPRARLGVRTLQAVQTAPSGTTSAAATTLVVNGPMEPGRNRLLGRR